MGTVLYEVDSISNAITILSLKILTHYEGHIYSPHSPTPPDEAVLLPDQVTVPVP